MQTFLDYRLLSGAERGPSRMPGGKTDAGRALPLPPGRTCTSYDKVTNGNCVGERGRYRPGGSSRRERPFGGIGDGDPDAVSAANYTAKMSAEATRLVM